MGAPKSVPADWRVGLFFHTFYPPDYRSVEWQGKPHNQGYVVREVKPGVLEVQYFSWLTGDPSTREVMPLSYFDGAAWYSSDEEMQRAGARLMGKSDPEEEVEIQRQIKQALGAKQGPAGKYAARGPPPPAPGTRRGKDPRAVSAKLRFNIFERDKFTCKYCGLSPPAVRLQIDHVIPIAKGGKDEEANLVTSCFECNNGKRDKVLHVVNPDEEPRV